MVKPWTEPPVPALRTYAMPSCTAMLAGKPPPDGVTWRSVRRGPSTSKTETVPLPELAAMRMFSSGS
ncbi:hypothetical protein GA0115236_114340 [Streptomyces sp. IgraMP-1]|nr:hypothetical protein GA0115236_114340 [Streptomyces sp. IgraMP-1]